MDCVHCKRSDDAVTHSLAQWMQRPIVPRMDSFATSRASARTDARYRLTADQRHIALRKSGLCGTRKRLAIGPSATFTNSARQVDRYRQRVAAVRHTVAALAGCHRHIETSARQRAGKAEPVIARKARYTDDRACRYFGSGPGQLRTSDLAAPERFGSCKIYRFGRSNIAERNHPIARFTHTITLTGARSQKDNARKAKPNRSGPHQYERARKMHYCQTRAESISNMVRQMPNRALDFMTQAPRIGRSS